MKKIKFGRGTPKTKLGQGLTKALKEAVEAEPVKATEVHHHTVTVKESRDKWARRHAKLSAGRNKTMINEMAEVLNTQNEEIHKLRGSIHGVAIELEKAKIQLQAHKEQKPQEKHIVTENIIHVPVKQDKKIIAGVMLAIVLSILALVNK